MITPPKPSPSPTIQRNSSRAWEAGVVTTNDDGRMPLNGLSNAVNVVLEQNGVLRPRKGTVRFLTQLPGKALGERFQFRVYGNNGSITNYLLAMCVLDGDTKANLYYCKENMPWTKIEGKDYDKSAKAHFLQLRGKILVFNSRDTASYIVTDTMPLAVTTYNLVIDPAKSPVATVNGTGMSGTGFKVYYAISFNSTVGETAGSPIVTQNVAIDRDMWNPDSQNIKVDWSGVTIPDGAKSTNVYVGVASDGGTAQLYQLVSGISIDVKTFTDNGTRSLNTSMPLPKTNGTKGPIATQGIVANGRIWLLDGSFDIRYGGDYDHEFDFSPAYNGGIIHLGAGTKKLPVAIVNYRDGKGEPCISVLTSGLSGTGGRYNVRYSEMSVAGTTISFWQPTEDTGNDGTDSPDGVIVHNNSLYYPSRDGFKTTGTLPQFQTVLSTKRLSNTIQPNIALLNTESIGKAVGAAFENMLYWALPEQSSENNRIWLMDLEHKGAWLFMNYAAEWIGTYDDNNGKTHLLLHRGRDIFAMTRQVMTTDDGKSFQTNAVSGHQKFSEDGREWARLIQVIFTILRPRGDINFSITAQTDDGLQTYNASQSFSGSSAVYGVGNGEADTGFNSQVGIGRVNRIPDETSNVSTADVIVEVDEDVQWWTWQISSTKAGVDYALSDVVAEFVNIGIKDLS